LRGILLIGNGARPAGYVAGMPPRPHLSIPTPGSRRAIVVGAGSFGTATAVLLARGGFRTTLQTRTPEQCARLERDRENRVVAAADPAAAQVTPTAVLFDLDGVLLDSRTAIVRCIEHALRAGGAAVPPARELERFIGPPLIDAFAELAGADRAAACLAAYRERYVHSSLEETMLVAGARPMLAAVAAQVPCAVATSKPRAFAEPLCERLGLSPYLHAVVGPELDAPEEVKAVTVARALAALGLGPGAAAPLVGDRSHDAEAARANRIPCVGVLWGIGDEAELLAAGADPVVGDPAALLAALGFGRTSTALGKEAGVPAAPDSRGPAPPPSLPPRS
jgi:phosphoglycolate phosphatase